MNRSSYQLIKFASIGWVTMYLSNILWTQRGLQEADYLILICLMIPILDGIKFRLTFTPRPELDFQWPLFVTEHRTAKERRQTPGRRNPYAIKWTGIEKRVGLERRSWTEPRRQFRLVS